MPNAAQSGICEVQLRYENEDEEIFNVFVCEREKDHEGPHQSGELVTWTNETSVRKRSIA